MPQDDAFPPGSLHRLGVQGSSCGLTSHHLAQSRSDIHLAVLWVLLEDAPFVTVANLFRPHRDSRQAQGVPGVKVVKEIQASYLQTLFLN